MRYEVEGYNLDDLIRKLTKRDIEIFDIYRANEKKICFTALDKFDKKIKRIIKNYKFSSLGSFKDRIKSVFISNIGVLIGVIVGICTYIVSTSFIWNIEIMGNENLESSEIVAVLKTNGVKVGGTNRIDSEYIEDILLNRYDMIAQASAIKRGTSIIINISEKLVYKDVQYEPITAKYSGIITDIELITGTLNVSVGDYVNVGDVLVYPYNLDGEGRQVSVVPNATIKADMFITGVADIGRTSKILQPTGRSEISYVYKIRDFNLFSGKTKNSFDIFSLEVYNEYISDIIPISRDVYVYREQEEVEITNDFALIVDSLLSKSEELATSNLPQGEILDKKSHTEIICDRLYAYTNITIHGEISASNQRKN